MRFQKMKKSVLLLVILLSAGFFSTAQMTQTIRGVVSDNILQQPLSGATVLLSPGNRTAVTDDKGNFRLTVVPIGRQTIIVSFIGYKEKAISNILVDAGKETVLTILLEEEIKQSAAVIIKANSKKNKVQNDMSLVSARAFTVEETQKYAAAVNDPARMATNYAGVAAADDGNNDIVIRGNSPTGLLWRMEGIDIPNPNHFSSAGSAGGGISILSSQLLSNSDFITGAFASEYGNALSGVFDLKLRKGNNEKREYTLQAGLLGLNAAAEGPFSKTSKASYLINYRYSTLSLLSKLGVNVGGNGTTNFQDFSYNIFIPTKKHGSFSFFGFGGLSSQKFNPDKDSIKWDSEEDRYGGSYISNLGFSGLSHSISLSSKTNIKTAIAWSKTQLEYDQTYIEKSYNLTHLYKDDYTTKKVTATSTLYHKFNAKNALRLGAIANFISFNYYQRSRENPNAPLKEVIDAKGNTQTVQGFAQWQHKLNRRFTFNAGLHYLQLLYNNSSSVEPRISAKWELNNKNSFSFGYGLHSQLQGLGVYFAQTKDAMGNVSHPNKSLEFSKAHHFVLSHQHSFSSNLKLRAEVYYQRLFDVPVSVYDSSTFSTLNIRGDYNADPLINRGKGKNYGAEISLEKYLSKNFYFMFSNSLYESKYTAADGIERNTKFNGNFISNLVAGKDFVSANHRRSFGINLRILYTGGYRTTPIDEAKSILEGYTIYKEKEAFSLQNPDYFRSDLKLSMKWNRKHYTSTLSLDIQNITNNLNVEGRHYDALKGKFITRYQTGLIPILNYKIDF